MKIEYKGIREVKNDDNNCFQSALNCIKTVALNYHNIKKDPQRILKIKPFIIQCDWKELEFPSHQKDWKKFELNNKTIALNILFVPYSTEKIRLAYKLKHNFKRENQVILLMIADGKKWRYVTVRSLSALLRGITSNHKEEFYCLCCYYSYSTKEKLKKHEKICNGHDCCYVEIPAEDNKILKYNQGEKSMRVPFIIYADLEFLLEKMPLCQNNLHKSYTERKPSIRLLVIHCLKIVYLMHQKLSLIVTGVKIV